MIPEGFPQDVGFKFPNYNRNICQVPLLIGQSFGLPVDEKLPADIASDPRLERRIKVLFFIDALAKADMEESRSEIMFLDHMLNQGSVYDLDSGVPTSTPLQAPAIHTGLTTQQLGNFEFYQYHPKVENGRRLMGSILMNTFENRNRDSLLSEGIEPTDIYDVKTIYRRLAPYARCYSMMPSEYVGSSFNATMGRGSILRGYRNLDELVSLLSTTVSNAEAPTYIIAYIPNVDLAGHRHGPGSPEHFGAQASVFEAIRKFRNGIPSSIAGDVTLGIIADHGQTRIGSPDDIVYFNAIKWVRDSLRPNFHGNVMIPTGGPSCMALHLKPECVDDVFEQLQTEYKDKAWIARSQDALAMGLFGRGEVNEHFSFTIGDILVFGHPDHYFWWKDSEDEAFVPGCHGGLAKRLMEISFILYGV